MKTRTGVERSEAPSTSPVRSARSKPAPDTLRVPFDVVNERVVIAATLVDESARRYCLGSLTIGNFFGEGHAEIWATLQELDRRKLSFDPATVRSIAPKVDADDLVELMRERPAAPPNLKHHVELMHYDTARLNAANGPVMQLLEALRDPKCPPDRMRALSKAVGGAFEGHGTAGAIRYARDLIVEQSLELTRRREGLAVYSSGIPALDKFEDGRARLIPGMAPGNITVVTGLSGSGKSTTMTNSLLGFVQQKRKTLVGAWEMGAGMSLEIAAAISLGFSRSDLSEGRYTEADQRELEQRMLELGEYLVFFELPFGRGRGAVNDQQLDKIEQVVTDSGCEIFVADLFRRAIKETGPDDEEQALFRMQDMAKRLKRHFILVQQQSIKKLEEAGRKDKRPTRDAIKGSAAWVEIADLIIGWHRPALFKSVEDTKIEAIILKQRYGKWPLAVEIEWDPEYGSLGAGRSISADADVWLDETGGDNDSEFKEFVAPKGRRR